jgi:hypothetical protein
MKDKLMASIVAGTIAGTIKNFIGLVAILTKINNLALWHYVSKLIFGHIPISISEHIISFFYELLVGISIGYIVLLNENKFYTKYRKTLYAGICAIFWLGVRAMIVDFKIDDLYHRNIIGAIMGVGMSVFFGIVFAQISQWLMKRK